MDKYRELGKVKKSISIEFVNNGYVLTMRTPKKEIKNNQEVLVSDPVTLVFETSKGIQTFLEEQLTAHEETTID